MDEGPAAARKGSRRAVRRRRTPTRRTLALGAGALTAGIAWAALVYAGIRFGQSARGGEGASWIYLGVAGLGAVAFLFLALMLITRLFSLGVPRPTGKRSAHRH